MIMLKTVLKSDAQRRHTAQSMMSFVGPMVPFVGYICAYIGPFIGYNRPLVRFERNSGFTLIELMVTLVIIGVLATLAAPSMSGFVKSNRLSTQINELIADLSFARSEAVKRGIDVTICRSQNQSTCANGTWTDGWIVIDAGSGDVLRVHEKIEGGNTLTVTGPDLADKVKYSGTGIADPLISGNPKFQLCDSTLPGRGKAIHIAITGRARVETASPC